MRSWISLPNSFPSFVFWGEIRLKRSLNRIHSYKIPTVWTHCLVVKKYSKPLNLKHILAPKKGERTKGGNLALLGYQNLTPNRVKNGAKCILETSYTIRSMIHPIQLSIHPFWRIYGCSKIRLSRFLIHDSFGARLNLAFWYS